MDTAQETNLPELPNGVALAAILAAGIGCFALGVFTVLVERFASVKNALNFSNPVGPLSGETILAVIVWILAWVGLHLWLGKCELNFKLMFGLSLAFIFLGFVGTFPEFYGWVAGN